MISYYWNHKSQKHDIIELWYHRTMISYVVFNNSLYPIWYHGVPRFQMVSYGSPHQQTAHCVWMRMDAYGKRYLRIMRIDILGNCVLWIAYMNCVYMRIYAYWFAYCVLRITAYWLRIDWVFIAYHAYWLRKSFAYILRICAYISFA